MKKLYNDEKHKYTLFSELSLTIQSVVLFIGAFAQDGGRAIVEDGRGLYGRQAACRDGPSADRGVWFGWTGMCFCGWNEGEKMKNHEETQREKRECKREGKKQDRKQVVLDKQNGQ